MNGIGKDEKSGNARNKLVAIVAYALIGCIFFLYLFTTKKQIDEYARYVLRNNIDMITVSMDARLNDARRSIVAAAGEVAGAWSGNRDQDIVGMVESIKGRYDFNVLEFVNARGINLMSGSNAFDASDREYYKEGIQGRTGLWVNYTPKESHEYLLDFYSPVYYQNEIVGVLVGAIGSRSSLSQITEASYMGRECIGVLYNEEERAIAASFNIEGEVYSDDIYDMFKLNAADREVFSRHVKERNGTVFIYEGEKGMGLACAKALQDSDWGIIMIIPSVSLSSIYSDYTKTGSITLGAISVVVALYIFYIMSISRQRYTARLKENDYIIKGFSKVYHTVFMLDYAKGTALCLRTRDPAAAKYEISEGKELPINDALMKYLTSSADTMGIEMISFLENVMYLRTILEKKGFFYVDFRLMAGGKGRLVIADMKPEITEKAGSDAADIQDGDDYCNRYLLGVTELE